MLITLVARVLNGHLKVIQWKTLIESQQQVSISGRDSQNIPIIFSRSTLETVRLNLSHINVGVVDSVSFVHAHIFDAFRTLVTSILVIFYLGT